MIYYWPIVQQSQLIMCISVVVCVDRGAELHSDCLLAGAMSLALCCILKKLTGSNILAVYAECPINKIILIRAVFIVSSLLSLLLISSLLIKLLNSNCTTKTERWQLDTHMKCLYFCCSSKCNLLEYRAVI